VCRTVERTASIVPCRRRSSRNRFVTWIEYGMPIPMAIAASIAVTGPNGMPVAAIIP
jgi:hypothetical protein